MEKPFSIEIAEYHTILREGLNALLSPPLAGRNLAAILIDRPQNRALNRIFSLEMSLPQGPGQGTKQWLGDVSIGPVFKNWALWPSLRRGLRRFLTSIMTGFP